MKKPTSLINTQQPDFSPENLKALRKAFGMPQAELAKRAGVTQASISAFESGEKNEVGQHVRARIANILVQAEFDRHRELGATPKTEVQKLQDRIAHLEAVDIVGRRLVKKLEDENAELKTTQRELISLLGWRTKNMAEDESQREAEAKLMAKIGAEKIPPAEEETLREEIENHGKKGKV